MKSKIFFIIASLVAAFSLGYIFYLVYQNRSSDKVVWNTYASALSFIIGIFLILLLNLPTQTKKTDIPVSYFFDSESLEPFFGKYDLITFYGPLTKYKGLLDRINESHEGLVGQVIMDNDEGEFFMDVLQRQILEKIYDLNKIGPLAMVGKYDLPWVKQINFSNIKDGVGVEEYSNKYRQFVWDDFHDALPENKLLKIPYDVAVIEGDPFPDGTYLPKGMEIVNITKNSFELNNNFVNVRFTFDKSLSPINSFNKITSKLFGFNDVENFTRYKIITHMISIDTTFNKWKSGHPDMDGYKIWVDTLYESLKNDFDVEKMMQEQKQKYLFAK